MPLACLQQALQAEKVHTANFRKLSEAAEQELRQLREANERFEEHMTEQLKRLQSELDKEREACESERLKSSQAQDQIMSLENEISNLKVKFRQQNQTCYRLDTFFFVMGRKLGFWERFHSFKILFFELLVYKLKHGLNTFVLMFFVFVFCFCFCFCFWNRYRRIDRLHNWTSEWWSSNKPRIALSVSQILAVVTRPRFDFVSAWICILPWLQQSHLIRGFKFISFACVFICIQLTQAIDAMKEAQGKYDRELLQHAAHVQQLTELKRQHAETKHRTLTVEQQLNEAHQQAQQAQAELAEDRARHESQIRSLEDLITNLRKHNDLLHAQFELQAKEQSDKHRQTIDALIVSTTGITSTATTTEGGEGSSEHMAQVADAARDSAQQIEDLRSMLLFLRRDNEIISCKLELSSTLNKSPHSNFMHCELVIFFLFWNISS
jgi:predicted nuclease with TOPRIM domain